MDEQHEICQKLQEMAKDNKYHSVVLTLAQVQELGGDEILMSFERAKLLLASKFSTYWIITPNPKPGSGDISYAEWHGDATAFHCAPGVR